MSWWIWLLIALIIGLVEVVSLTFVLLWISIAALITALCSALVDNLWVQVGLLVIISTILLIVTRPLSRKWRQGSQGYENPQHAVVGKTGIVVTGGGESGLSTVKIEGHMWSARSDEPLLPGQPIHVIHAGAAVLEVAPTVEN